MSVGSVSVAPAVSPASTNDRPAHPSRTRACIALGLLIALVLQAGVALMTPRDRWTEDRASMKALRHGAATVSVPGQVAKPGVNAKGEIDPNC